MTIRVDSEIGQLRRVLVHRPDLEIDWMVPRMMEELLFDDILYAKEAREEHEGFCRVLEQAGVETLDAKDLLAEILNDETARDELFEDLARHDELPPQGAAAFDGLDAVALAGCLVSGLRKPDGYVTTESLLFDLPPVPNYFFQRDPLLILGDRVVVSAMASDARRREALLSRALFRNHPKLAGYRGLFSIEGDPMGPDFPAGGDPPTLEGGDVVIASRDTLLVGISERTNRQGAERLAEYLRVEKTGFRHLLMVDLPSERAYMHLDTVFTLIDEGTCLAYLPVIEPGRRLTGRVYYVDLAARELSFVVRPSLLETLKLLGIELDVVPCGGDDDVLFQEREQWTDGANAFAIAPGVIVLYRRNRRTVEALSRRGWRVIREDDVISGAEPVLGEGRTVIVVEGDELSRARGGPRCMTMPLERESLGSR